MFLEKTLWYSNLQI